MFSAYWGLRENPFSLSPDPGFLYRSQHHQDALDKLIYGVRTRKGFLLLTGEVGTGKTTLLECLRDYLTAESIEFAAIDNSRVTVDQFFELLAYTLDLPRARTKTEVLFALNDVLMRQADAQRTTVLIVDEAQNLSSDVLEEIRLLGNLESRAGKLLQIVLAGQPEFEQKLETPELRQLKQRILLRCRLQALSEEETGEYVATRLDLAGMPHQTVFPRDLLAEIYIRSTGVPRIINAICDNLLLSACAADSYVATLPMLDEVSEELCLERCAPPMIQRPAPALLHPPVAEPPPAPQYKMVVPPMAAPAAIAVPLPLSSPVASRAPKPPRRFPKTALLIGVLVGFTFLAVGVWSGIRPVSSHADVSPPPITERQPLPSEQNTSDSLPARAPAQAPSPRSPRKLPSEVRRAFVPPSVAKPPEVAMAIPLVAAPELVPRPDPPPPLAAPAPLRAPEIPKAPPPVPAVSAVAAPVVTAPSAPPSRFAGAWTFPAGGLFHGAQPEVAEMEIRVEDDRLMASLSVRFKSASKNTIEPLLRFVFSGKLQSGFSQSFNLESVSGGRGTIELIPGLAPNLLEVNFFSRLGAQSQSGNMILIKRGGK